MTVPYRDQVFCPHCRKWHPAEHSLNQWIRGNPELDSRKHGIVRLDCDVLIHRYMVNEDRFRKRDVQFSLPNMGRLTGDPMDTFNSYKTDPAGGVTPLACDQSALATIIALLPYCDTVDLRELQLNHVPRERSRAVSSEVRTRAVRLAEKTVAVPVAEIRRATRDAAAVVMEDDGAPD